MPPIVVASHSETAEAADGLALGALLAAARSAPLLVAPVLTGTRSDETTPREAQRAARCPLVVVPAASPVSNLDVRASGRT